MAASRPPRARPPQAHPLGRLALSDSLIHRVNVSLTDSYTTCMAWTATFPTSLPPTMNLFKRL
eukprot:9491125-Pyramimonas_sp.AAC.1